MKEIFLIWLLSNVLFAHGGGTAGKGGNSHPPTAHQASHTPQYGHLKSSLCSMNQAMMDMQKDVFNPLYRQRYQDSLLKVGQAQKAMDQYAQSTGMESSEIQSMKQMLADDVNNYVPDTPAVRYDSTKVDSDTSINIADVKATGNFAANDARGVGPLSSSLESGSLSQNKNGVAANPEIAKLPLAGAANAGSALAQSAGSGKQSLGFAGSFVGGSGKIETKEEQAKGVSDLAEGKRQGQLRLSSEESSDTEKNAIGSEGEDGEDTEFENVKNLNLTGPKGVPVEIAVAESRGLASKKPHHRFGFLSSPMGINLEGFPVNSVMIPWLIAILILLGVIFLLLQRRQAQLSFGGEMIALADPGFQNPAAFRIRFDARLSAWVLCRQTNGFEKVLAEICVGSVVRGNSINRSSSQNYRLDRNGEWVPTHEGEQFLLNLKHRMQF